METEKNPSNIKVSVVRRPCLGRRMPININIKKKVCFVNASYSHMIILP